jgi:hypothetical protein
MELSEFLTQTQAEVRSEIGDRLGTTGTGYPYPESVFAEVVMRHMADVGMTFDEPVACHVERTVGKAILRLSGYSVSAETDELDLFVSLYSGVDDLTPVPDAETKSAAERCLQFLTRCVDGRLLKDMDESDDAYPFVLTVKEMYARLEQIRIYVLTDRQAKAKNFKAREVNGKTVKLEVIDIERLHRHWSEGKPRDELVVDFGQVCGGALPCVYVRGEAADYDYALTAFPGEALHFLYEKYGARLLEANVRSFLSATGKVNKGIRETLMKLPEHFMAYNNGIVVVADEMQMGQTDDGGPGILWLKGMQIVNGGQTTASIYFVKKREPDTDLRRVRVPTKIIVLRDMDSTAEEALISDISRYSNSQNAVRLSDLSANRPFHVVVEQLSLTTYCPDGVGRWFYERAAGSYNTMLSREGTTPARLKKLKETMPSARRITKTDLAKYINVWDQRPELVSLGAQKNFGEFMESLGGSQGESSAPLPDAAAYKRMIAKAILFKKANALVRPMFQAFQGNVVVYLVSMLANRVGDKLHLDRIWDRQDISPELLDQLRTWAPEVNAVLHKTASGRMISEWAKKPECWDEVRKAHYSAPAVGIPELR